MSEQRTRTALCGLQWTLGIVILVEAILFLMPAQRQAFARTHLPGVLRSILGWAEIVGVVLMLIPRTTVRGAWLLAIIFALAIIIHLLHGMYGVGNLVVYTAASWAVAFGKS